MKQLLFACLMVGASAAGARAEQAADGSSSLSRPYHVGSSAFLVMNVIHDEKSPHFFQLDVGHQLTSKDRLTIQTIAWRYYHPLGIAWQDSPEADVNAYQGHVRAVGVGVDYQRMLTKGFFSSVSASPVFSRYYDRQNEKVASALMLYLTGRVGYHLGLGNRLFVEPSIAFNYWPVSTNAPAAFDAQDDRWPSYFLFEPGLNVGFRF